MKRQLYVHVGEVVSATCYDSDKEGTAERDVQCMLRVGLVCAGCYFCGGDCGRIACMSNERPDGEDVIFKTL